MALRMRYLNGRDTGGPTCRTLEPGRTFNAVLNIGCKDPKGYYYTKDNGSKKKQKKHSVAIQLAQTHILLAVCITTNI